MRQVNRLIFQQNRHNSLILILLVFAKGSSPFMLPPPSAFKTITILIEQRNFIQSKSGECNHQLNNIPSNPLTNCEMQRQKEQIGCGIHRLTMELSNISLQFTPIAKMQMSA